MHYEFILSFIFVLLGGVFLATDDFHMLQQNSYFNSRYLKWLGKNLERYIIRIAWICVVILSFAIRIGSHNIIGCAVTLAYLLWAALGAVKRQKKAIKPLVFTPRVIRMYVTATLLLALAFAFALLMFDKVDATVIPLLVLATETPIIVLLANVINAPAEAFFRNRFIKDAKRILKSASDLKTIGITGSFGKTSTKFILARILEEKYNLTYTPASFNTPMGVVRTVREQLKPSDSLFICEMGAKNIGDIKEICDIVNPDIAIISSVGAQHLETFKSVENVAKTKFELADAVSKKEGKVYVNFDSEAAKAYSANYNNIVSFGTTADCDISISNIKCGRYGSEFDVKYGDTAIHLISKLLGIHNVLNIAGAVGVALDLGVGETDIKYAVSHLKPVEHRLEMKPFINGAVLIDDAYNANPTGSAEAVNVLASFEGMRRIIVTPGLVELGDKEYECNKQLGALAAQKLDDVVLVGMERSVPLAEGAKEAGIDSERLHIVPTFKDAMVLLHQIADGNTVVLFENDLPDNYAK